MESGDENNVIRRKRRIDRERGRERRGKSALLEFNIVYHARRCARERRSVYAHMQSDVYVHRDMAVCTMQEKIFRTIWL